MAKIFFGCSMRGGRANLNREEILKVRSAIEELGHELISTHQLEKGILEKESKLASREIYDRDYNWLKEADAGIFEISNPSLGTGSEISDILHMHKPALCLFKKEIENSVSEYIRGKAGSEFITTPIECEGYESLAEAKQIIKNFVEKHLAKA